MSFEEKLDRLLVETLIVKKTIQNLLADLPPSAPIAEKEVLTVDECAELTSMKKSTLYKLTHQRRIPFFKPTGSRIFFKRDEILKWLQSNRIDTDAEMDQSAASHLVRRRRIRKM